MNETVQRGARLTFSWVAMATGALALALYVFGVVLLVLYGTLSKDFGWTATSLDGRVLVETVDPAGAAAGRLQPGDELVAIDGDTRVTRVPLRLKARTIRPDQPYTVRVLRRGQPHDVELAPRLAGNYDQLAQSVSIFLVSFAWAAVAIMVAVLRPDSGIARLAFAAGITQALILLRFSLSTTAPFLEGAPRLVFYLLIFPFTPLQLALGYHFYYRFPPGVPGGPIWSAVAAALYATAAVLGLGYRGMLAVLNVMPADTAIEFFSRYGSSIARVEPFDGVFYPIAGMAMAAVVVRNYRLVADPDRVRRLKWLLYGAAAGLGPFIVEELVSTIRVTVGLPPLSREWSVVGNAATVTIPISFGYAIVKHRVFDINVVVRRGLQYLLARNALRLMLSLPILALAFVILSNRHLTLADVVSQHSSYLLLILAAAASLRFRSRLSVWVDRKFFREAYDREQILLRLLDEIGRIDALPEIAAIVSRELESAFHPKALYVWYRQGTSARLKLGYSSGAHPKLPPVAGDPALIGMLEQKGTIVEVPVSGSSLDLSAEQRYWLREWDVHLIVPIGGTHARLLGMLMLGEKMSEEPYSGADRKLLQALANQMAVIADKAQLVERLDHDRRIQRDVLGRVDANQMNFVKECRSCGTCYDTWTDVCATDGAELTLSLPVERTIDGKYRLDRLIGKGGMGAVYEAADLRLDRRVALKIMVGRAFGDHGSIRRFEREARAAARLNHPNIITVHDYGAIGADGAYLVMELLPGVTLRTEMARLGVLSTATAADWFEQMLEGIKAAHDQHVIHRDLKPENILILKESRGGGTVKILDFGLAKVRPTDAVETVSVTLAGDVVGTAGYMPPEHLIGNEVDERGDLFSVGVIVVEALTGRRPFPGRTPGEMLLAIYHEPYHLAGDSPEVRHLDAVIQRCIARHPDDRFPSAGALQAELIPAIRACPTFYRTNAVGSDGETRTS